MINYYDPKIDLTLLGCGFLGCYHVGAIYLLTQIWPHKPFNKICGASSGGIVGALIISGVSIEQTLAAGMELIRKFKSFFVKPSKLIKIDMLKAIKDIIDEILPIDAHLNCENKLGLSLTKLWSFENIFVTKFDNRNELIDAIIAGCFIPIWSGSKVPIYKGNKFIDGAYSNNRPNFEFTQEDKKFGFRQLQLSPFSSSDVDISPNDLNCLSLGTIKAMGSRYNTNLKNIIRSIYAMSFICSNYAPFVISGFNDMKEYILNNSDELIKCWQCFYQKPNDFFQTTNNDFDDIRKNRNRNSCIGCLKLLEKIDSLKISQELLKISVLR